MGKAAKRIQSKFTIVQDQREKQPWTFDSFTERRKRGGKMVDVPIEQPVVVRYMSTSDYTLDGYSDQFLIERKSVKDIVQTVTQHKDRFKRELERMDEVRCPFVIVEGDWIDVLRTCTLVCNYNPTALGAAILSMQIKYKAQWIFRPTRAIAIRTAYKLMDLFYRKHRT